MPVCFEVSINGGAPVVAGNEHAAVLSVTASYVTKRNESEVSVGGLVSMPESEVEHWDWLEQQLKPGDELCIRVLADGEVSQPQKRVRQNKDFAQQQEREYYERLKKKYEGGQ